MALCFTNQVCATSVVYKLHHPPSLLCRVRQNKHIFFNRFVLKIVPVQSLEPKKKVGVFRPFADLLRPIPGWPKWYAGTSAQAKIYQYRYVQSMICENVRIHVRIRGFEACRYCCTDSFSERVSSAVTGEEGRRMQFKARGLSFQVVEVAPRRDCGFPVYVYISNRWYVYIYISYPGLTSSHIPGTY